MDHETQNDIEYFITTFVVVVLFIFVFIVGPLAVYIDYTNRINYINNLTPVSQTNENLNKCVICEQKFPNSTTKDVTKYIKNKKEKEKYILFNCDFCKSEYLINLEIVEDNIK